MGQWQVEVVTSQSRRVFIDCPTCVISPYRIQEGDNTECPIVKCRDMTEVPISCAAFPPTTQDNISLQGHFCCYKKVLRSFHYKRETWPNKMDFMIPGYVQ